VVIPDFAISVANKEIVIPVRIDVLKPGTGAITDIDIQSSVFKYLFQRLVDFGTRLQGLIKAGGSIENPGRVKALKKTIARILTVIREEEISI